ncbi:MAG: hypothetical protein K9K64_09690 [Desulfohalobiaceae bacterium]|nr:hypothetical protein [Desulfohalobiaceae bacterium]
MGSLQTATIFLVFFCAGLILLILGLFIQKSGNRRAREALHKSEQRHLLALESSTDGLWDWEIPAGRSWKSGPDVRLDSGHH